jgi:spermidine/putrescine ABC transporter ATP-binding subunit
MSRSGIVIRGLTKRFGSVVAVDNVDLVINSNEFLTLLGPSGCGKTTTLRCIAGLEPPDSGEIYIGDQMVWGAGRMVPAHKRHLGMVFQSYAIWPHMTVYNNVAFPLKIQGMNRNDERHYVEEALKLVGLADYGQRYPSQISGGQQQRVALARAIVARPSVILYDEPLSNLDAKLREQMRVELRHLHERLGVTSVYVTHDQQEAMALSDQLCIMNNGKIVQKGKPREIYEQPADRFVTGFIGSANFFRIAEVRLKEGTVLLKGGIVVRIADVSRALMNNELNSAKTFTIRPHQIGIGNEDATRASGAINLFSGVVREAMYLGDRFRYVVEIAEDCRLTVEQVAGPDLQRIGDRVGVTLPPEACIIV